MVGGGASIEAGLEKPYSRGLDASKDKVIQEETGLGTVQCKKLYSKGRSRSAVDRGGDEDYPRGG